MRVDLSADDGRSSHSEETEHAVPEMVDRQIGDHPFQIRLRPRRERCKDNRANRQSKQPWAEDSNFVREKRKQQTYETVNAHLGEHTRQHHRHAGWCALICVGQPGVKWKERHLDRQSEKNSSKGEPRDLAVEQPVFSEIRERGEVERTFCEINS